MITQQPLNSTFLLLISLLLLAPVESIGQEKWSQRPILIQNEKGQYVSIDMGRRIVVTRDDGSEIKAPLQSFDGQRLAFSKDTVDLANAAQIAIFPTLSQIGGTLGTGLGSALGVTGIALLISAVSAGGMGSNEVIEFLAGLALAGIAIPSLLTGLNLFKQTRVFKLKGEDAWEVVST